LSFTTAIIGRSEHPLNLYSQRLIVIVLGDQSSRLRGGGHFDLNSTFFCLLIDISQYGQR
jgi:hypothetical protein